LATGWPRGFSNNHGLLLLRQRRLATATNGFGKPSQSTLPEALLPMIDDGTIDLQSLRRGLLAESISTIENNPGSPHFPLCRRGSVDQLSQFAPLLIGNLQNLNRTWHIGDYADSGRFCIAIS